MQYSELNPLDVLASAAVHCDPSESSKQLKGNSKNSKPEQGEEVKEKSDSCSQSTHATLPVNGAASTAQASANNDRKSKALPSPHLLRVVQQNKSPLSPVTSALITEKLTSNNKMTISRPSAVKNTKIVQLVSRKNPSVSNGGSDTQSVQEHATHKHEDDEGYCSRSSLDSPGQCARSDSDASDPRSPSAVSVANTDSTTTTKTNQSSKLVFIGKSCAEQKPAAAEVAAQTRELQPSTSCERVSRSAAEQSSSSSLLLCSRRVTPSPPPVSSHLSADDSTEAPHNLPNESPNLHLKQTAVVGSTELLASEVQAPVSSQTSCTATSEVVLKDSCNVGHVGPDKGPACVNDSRSTTASSKNSCKSDSDSSRSGCDQAASSDDVTLASQPINNIESSSQNVAETIELQPSIASSSVTAQAMVSPSIAASLSNSAKDDDEIIDVLGLDESTTTTATTTKLEPTLNTFSQNKNVTWQVAPVSTPSTRTAPLRMNNNNNRRVTSNSQSVTSLLSNGSLSAKPLTYLVMPSQNKTASLLLPQSVLTKQQSTGAQSLQRVQYVVTGDKSAQSDASLAQRKNDAWTVLALNSVASASNSSTNNKQKPLPLLIKASPLLQNGLVLTSRSSRSLVTKFDATTALAAGSSLVVASNSSFSTPQAQFATTHRLLDSASATLVTANTDKNRG